MRSRHFARGRSGRSNEQRSCWVLNENNARRLRAAGTDVASSQEEKEESHDADRVDRCLRFRADVAARFWNRFGAESGR
jgi:hypothetical protein